MITALIASLVASFPGGDVSDLARSISEKSKLPVVFEAGASERAPAFEYNVDDLNELARVVLANTGFKRAAGTQHVFSHGRLGSWNFGIGAVTRLADHKAWQKAGAGLPEGFLVDGRVTLQTKPNEAISLAQFPTTLLPKPLQVHWLLTGLGLKTWVTDLPVQDFLSYLAKASGGKLLQRQDRFQIDIDPIEIQRRALATLAEVQKNKAYRNLPTRDQFEIELSRNALSSLSPSMLSQALLTQGSRVRFEIPSAMRPAIYSYVTALLSNTATEGTLPQVEQGFTVTLAIEQTAQTSETMERDLRDRMRQGRNRNSANRLMQIDPRIWGYAEMDSRFRVTLQLATVPDRLGRQSAAVRLP